MKSTESIFVQIPAYRDSQLASTIESLLANAYNKKRLNISICWQHSRSEKLPGKIVSLKNINIIDVNYKHSKGANWARSVIQKYYSGEPYTLLADSHTRFAKHWDRKLIGMIRILKSSRTQKPIISGYPPYFLDPCTYPKDRLNYPQKMYAHAHDYNLLTRFNTMPIPLYKWLKAPISAQFLSMGFLFAEGSFNLEIPFDPNIYFFGDDITTAVRSYCHGYNFFHPHRLIAWHLYDRKTRITHWEDHKNWRELNQSSYERIYRIFKGENFPGYDLGKQRTIKGYESYIGCKLIINEPN